LKLSFKTHSTFNIVD